MKTIILLAGFGTRLRPLTWSRPKPILRVAGNTVVGHILDRLAAVTTDEVIFVVGYRGDQIESWIRQNYPQLDTHFVIQEEALGQAHAVWLCRDYLDDYEDVLLAFGDGIIEADYSALPDPQADGVFLVKEIDDPRRFGISVLDQEGYIRQIIEKPPTMEHKLAVVGIYWFRSGRYLAQSVDRLIKSGRKTLGEYFMADAFQLMLEEGARLRTMTARQWADAGTPEAILDSNRRLLAAGQGSADALERGFADGFTVMPPVYIHPSADIEASVIGPYTTIEAGVKVRNAVISNSIIEPGAQIQNCVLENSLIGENAEVSGQRKAIFVGDDSSVDVG
jgi:glucose-1-phosphate thymidylyltransferase